MVRSAAPNSTSKGARPSRGSTTVVLCTRKTNRTAKPRKPSIERRVRWPLCAISKVSASQAVRRMELRSGLVILPVPRDEVRDAALDGGVGLESDVVHQRVEVGISGRHVPLLLRQHVLLGLLAEALFDDLDVTHQLHRLIVADVIEPIRRVAAGGVGRVAAPVGIGYGH